MLNACPRCQRTFPEEGSAFCPADGTALVPIASLPVPSDPADPIVGRLLADRFEVRRVIADGGMGRVYEARDTRGERRVAVKILHPDIAEDSVNIERFHREASTSAALRHPHIVEVIDFAQTPLPGRPHPGWYLAMEYLDGEELRAVIDREKILPIARIVRVVSQLALALDTAHAAGFVHRDLKPDNVFLVRSEAGDVVKLLDFGSVKFTRGQDKGNKLTVMGTTIGSPFYMSPEQARGSHDLDHRADCWAIAVILYEALVGKVPFRGQNGPQILFRILGDEPLPPSMANDAAAPELDDVLVKGLTKDPAGRFASMGALADALGHAMGLGGDHRRWAATAESEINTEISAHKAPAPDRSPVVTPEPAPPRAEDRAAFPREPHELRVPISKPPLGVYVIAGVALLGLLALFFAMRR